MITDVTKLAREAGMPDPMVFRNRLLMAAARGARVQEYSACLNAWVEADFLPKLSDITDECRIHPDDEHLQYGPISTALREIAQSGKPPHTIPGLMAETAFREELMFEYCASTGDGNQLTRSLFLLILAEALADEGL